MSKVMSIVISLASLKKFALRAFFTFSASYFIAHIIVALRDGWLR